MDLRWRPISRDSERQVKVILHPTASIYEVKRGLDPGSDDSVDLSEFVKDCTQSAFEMTVTLAFNRELFGDYQPKPYQILEVQLLQDNEWKPLWIGFIDAISSFTMSRGERQMQLIAKSRDQQPTWREAPRVTTLFPQLTALTYIAKQVARFTDMKGDEIKLPFSSMATPHSNTQLTDMTSWDMLETIFLPLGWKPFIDALGNLRAASKDLQLRRPDLILDSDRMIKVGGQRVRPPISRVRLSWLSPELKIWRQQGRMLNQFSLTLGWWIPFWHHEVRFSDDYTQRAEKTFPKVIQNPNFLHIPFLTWEWKQQTPVKGKMYFKNKAWMAELFVTIMTWSAKHALPETVVSVGLVGSVGVTQPETGRMFEAIEMVTTMITMLNATTGAWEIWGTPYEYVHAKNITEAFDTGQPEWVNKATDLDNNFIAHEEHAKAVAIRELIFQARSANKWSVTIVDDPTIEYGDILQFPDGSQIFVEDYHRTLTRGSEATLEVQGFIVGYAKAGSFKYIGKIGGGTPDIGIGAPGQPGGGPEVPPPSSGGDGVPSGPGSKGDPIIPMTADPVATDNYIKASLYHYGRKDLGYWSRLVHAPEPWGPAGNGKWYIGWDAYMEARMAPADTGSADHALLDQPSQYQTPPPPDYPPGGWQ